MAILEICRVKKLNGADLKFCYELMKERITEPNINISHTKMPTWEQHLAHFEKNNPYKEYFFLKKGDGLRVGICYITHKNEIGIFVSKKYQKLGFGKKALQYVLHFYGNETILANINPNNEVSRKLFEGLGAELIQVTYAIKPDKERKKQNASLYKRRNGNTWQGNHKAAAKLQSCGAYRDLLKGRSKTSGNGAGISRIPAKHHALYSRGRSFSESGNAIDVRL